MFDQAWWCGYGPAEDPEIVVCALVGERSDTGGTSAAPAALEVFAKYFKKDIGEISVVSTSETD
jgi:cell division protein FtsI/penicillin-binding protein 2